MNILPIAASANNAGLAPDPQAPPAQASPLVLVIDDDGVMRLLVRDTLEGDGFRVEEAADGEAGLALFPDLRPDVVLLDALMPGIDGFDTCVALRRLADGARVPVLMMTGLDDTASVNRAYQAGATDFVTKPIAWPILTHRVRYLLRASQTLAALARSEERLAESQRMAKLGHWDWCLTRATVDRSTEVLRILDGDVATFPAGYRASRPMRSKSRSPRASSCTTSRPRSRP